MTPRLKFGFCLSFVAASLFAAPAAAQTMKDFVSSSETPVLYLGIDFYKAKLIDDPIANEMDIRDRQFDGINQVVINEPKKYDLPSAFHKSNVDHDISGVSKRNHEADAEQIKSTNTADFRRLKESDIIAEAKALDYPLDKKGLGVVFIVEAMSKSGKASAIWVTFVDTKAKKVLYTERMEADTHSGFSFRNLWASSIKDLLDNMEGKKFKEWKSKFQ